jgi:hypothetical protein
MTQPYSHHVKTAGGWRSALQGASNAGRTAAAAAGRGLRPAGQAVFAPTGRAPRSAAPVTRTSAAVKGNLIRPAVYAATVPVGAHIIGGVLEGNEDMALRELAVQQELMHMGMSAPEARDVAWKATYGLMGNTALHVAENPYYYLAQGGGNNPIDQGVSEVAGSFMPYDFKTGARQFGNVMTQGGPVGGAVALGSSALLNLLDSAGDRLPEIVQDYSRQVEGMTPEQRVQHVQDSRYSAFVQDYLNSSMPDIARAYNNLSPEQQAAKRDAAIARAQQLAAPYVKADIGPDGTPILRAGPKLVEPLAQNADQARARYNELVKQYAPPYLRRDLGIAFNRGRRAVEQAPNPVQAGQALGQSISDSASSIARQHGSTMAIDAYNRWNSERNPLRGMIDPFELYGKLKR